MKPEKTVTDEPIEADDLYELSTLELSVLALSYGRACAGTGISFEELTVLCADSEFPEADILNALHDLEEDGLLALPRITRSPVDTPIRPIVPGGSPHKVAMKVRMPPLWSTKERIWGLWISRELPEEFVEEVRDVRKRLHESSHAADVEGKVAALKDRVRLLEQWAEQMPAERSQAVYAALEKFRTVLENEEINLSAHRRKAAADHGK